MDSSSREQPFAALKELSARLDTEITNAANRLEGRRVQSPACAMKIFDRAAALEAQRQIIKCQMKAVVKEEEATIQALKECIRQADRDNEETLRKLIPLGLKVPDDLLPAVEHLHLSGEPCATEELSTTSATAESPCSSVGVVANLDQVFQGKAVRCSQLRKPSQLASHLSRPPQWPPSRDPFGSRPVRPLGGKSKLERYLAEMDDDNTMTMMKCKPTPVTVPAEKPAASTQAVEDVVQSFQPLDDQQDEPEEATAFPALSRALMEETFTSGLEPLPATPAPKEKILGKGDELASWKLPERKMPDVCATPILKLPDFEEHSTVNFKVPEFGTQKPTVTTPEFKEFSTPTVLKERKAAAPW